MKKVLAVLLFLGLSGCYYVEEGYYDEVYSVPSYGYAYSEPSVIYAQPIVTYYEGPSHPHHHYRPAPHHHYRSAPHYYSRPAPHHGGHHGNHHESRPAKGHSSHRPHR